jgi:hypothetical protein
VKQLTYYAINTDSCITSDLEEIERLIEDEASCVKPLRVDITEFKRVPQFNSFLRQRFLNPETKLDFW